MKKFILAAIVAATSICANAQVWMGGSLGFDVVNPEGDKNNTTNFSIAPVVGYSLSEKWDIALEFGYKSQSYENDALSTKDNFYVAPFARYNFAKCGIATFFVDGGFAFGSSEMSVDSEGCVNNYEDKSTFQIGLRPGVKVELSHKVELDAKLGWLGYRSVTDVKSRYGFNVNNEALSFGMTWKF